MSASYTKTPIFIVGAGRSGTNMLRDLLCRLPQFVTWPCDEINYIWRYGNRSFPTDQFTRDMASDKSARYIRKQFSALQRKHPEKTIIEKTCANSLRCGFLHEIFPDARFIHIIRDGRDVAASAALRWGASLDLGYVLKKARFVPLSDVPFYAFRYLKSRAHKIVSGESRLSTWGPKFDGMEECFIENSLLGGCAIQWEACVLSSLTQLAEVPASQVMEVRYEAFTSEPAQGLEEISNFLAVDCPVNSRIVDGVSSRSVGKWKQQVTEEQHSEIVQLVGDTLRRLGYSDPKPLQ